MRSRALQWRRDALNASLLLWLLLALVLPGSVLAQPVPATDPVPRVAFPRTNVGNISTIGPRTVDASNAAKFSFGVASNGAIFANTADRLPTPGGQSIPIGVSGTIAKPSVAAAIGRFARKALPVLSVGSALYDLGNELGYALDNSGGTLVVQKPSPGLVCTTAPCFQYRGNFLANRPWDYNPVSACQTHSSLSGASYIGIYGSGASVYCQNSSTTFQLLSQPAPPQVPTYTPSTVQEFTDAIAARSGWPSSSALARATVDAINSGEALQVDPATVTGPATSPGASSQTVNNTANETTTNTVTHHHTYAGPSITTTTVTNSVTTNNTTGAVTNSSTTTQEVVQPSPSSPDEPAPFEMPCGVSGAPPCAVKVDESGTPAYDPQSLKLDPALEAQAEALRDLAGGSGDKTGMFDSWRSLFTLPAIRQCEAIEMPEVRGMQVPDLNPCPYVDWVRGLMAWIWALAGLAFCWAQVKEAMA